MDGALAQQQQKGASSASISHPASHMWRSAKVGHEPSDAACKRLNITNLEVPKVERFPRAGIALENRGLEGTETRESSFIAPGGRHMASRACLQALDETPHAFHAPPLPGWASLPPSEFTAVALWLP
jgi:hypothetical protein